MKTFSKGFIFSIFLLAGFLLNAQNAKKDSILYEKAIMDAMYPRIENVSNDLISINKSNKDLVWKEVNGDTFLLVVSWKGDDTFFKPFLNWGYYNTQSWPLWVTAAPQLLDFMKKEKPANADRRLKQLLGLPPNSVYKYFVEFWVKPEDLFRPCPDNEITDTKCDVCFPANVDSTYKAWVNNSRIDRYYKCGLYNQYPWTALGYTYDWNPKNKTHVGMSEFVIPANTNVVVNAIYTTEDYLNKK